MENNKKRYAYFEDVIQFSKWYHQKNGKKLSYSRFIKRFTESQLLELMEEENIKRKDQRSFNGKKALETNKQSGLTKKRSIVGNLKSIETRSTISNSEKLDIINTISLVKPEFTLKDIKDECLKRGKTDKNYWIKLSRNTNFCIKIHQGKLGCNYDVSIYKKIQ